MTTLAPAPGSGRVPPIERSAHRPPIRSSVVASILAFGFATVAFSVWANMLPMAGGVIATGEVAVEANRRGVQSKAGGTIKALHVSEGTRVEKGDVVATFDRVEAKADFDVFDAVYMRTLAKHSRLKSEAAGDARIGWADELLRRQDEKQVAQLMQFEEELFDARRQHLEGRREVLLSRIEEFRTRRDAIAAQLKGMRDRLSLTREEAANVGELLQKGYERRPRLLELQRDIAELLGEVGALESNLASLREGENGAELELASLTYQHRTDVIGELTRAEGELAEYVERRLRAKALLENTELRAPEAGIVVGLNFYGEGGVVGPGEVIFDLVPTPDTLLVVARIRTEDIDAVHLGQSAEIRLLAFNQKYTDPVPGEVTHVSADRLVNSATQEPYYEVFVRLAPHNQWVRSDLQLQPGMPVDVVLTTEERTFLEYLMSPILRAMFLGFREE
ncbi:MAG: HlyD family type I secretion periplasmic adaptor subunit [Thalassobaculum sp.]